MKTPRKDLRKVGYWSGNEMSGNPTWYPELPRVEDFIDEDWGGPERTAVLSYLELPVHNRISMRGMSRCRCCGQMNGSQDIDDGVWCWPDGFSYYLLNHSVRPPEEFIDHCVRRMKDHVQPS